MYFGAFKSVFPGYWENIPGEIRAQVPIVSGLIKALFVVYFIQVDCISIRKGKLRVTGGRKVMLPLLVIRNGRLPKSWDMRDLTIPGRTARFFLCFAAACHA